MNPRRILLTSLYLPGDSKIGVGHQVEGLANALVDRGHAVTVASPDRPGPGARYRHHPYPSGPPLRLLRFPWALRSEDWADYDILHAHGEDWFLAGVDRPAHVRTVHGSGFAEARRIPGAKEKVRMAAIGAGEVVSSVLADRSVGVSEATRRVYPWLDAVIGCGVDLDRFAAPPCADPDPTILFGGTYEHRKRGRHVQEVFRDVIRPARPDARLWMVCTDAPAAPGVEVLGRLSDAELADRYRRAWVFTLPSTYEGFGVPYVEAMAAGCPVVATSNPGSEEVLERGRLGRIVADHDLGPAILELLGDPTARAAMVEQGRARSAQYGWGAIVTAYEQIYDDALAARDARDPGAGRWVRRGAGRRSRRKASR